MGGSTTIDQESNEKLQPVSATRSEGALVKVLLASHIRHTDMPSQKTDPAGLKPPKVHHHRALSRLHHELANAVAALTGKRVRRLPITADAILRA